MLKERNKNTELSELLALEAVSLVTKRGRLTCFGHVEHKDNGDWVKPCMSVEVEERMPERNPMGLC